MTLPEAAASPIDSPRGMAVLETALSRRTVLAGGLAAASLGFPAGLAARARGLSINLLGQALIKHDLCAQSWPQAADLQKLLSGADASFSDLEVVIEGPRAGAPTRSDLTALHTADASVIDCLKTLGINLLATSNNHAFDLGTGGIIDTLAAVRSRGIVHAGSGFTLAEASGPSYLPTESGHIALVSFATGMVRPGGAATSFRPGVAEIQRAANGALEESDVQRTLAAIAAAAAGADVVIAYQHNHYWEPENWRTPAWQRQLARQCVDAGASVFVAHGTPLLQGLEMYRGRPLFHGLGSFIFQTEKAPDFYGPWAWQSLVATCRFSNGEFAGAELIPVQLNATGIGGNEDLATRGRPALATPAEAATILERVASLSRELGFDLPHDGKIARLSP